MVGASTGLCAAGFHALLDNAADIRALLGEAGPDTTWQELAVLAAVCGASAGAAAWLVSRFVPEAAGSGIPQVLDALETGAPIRWGRLIPVKFIGGLGAIGSGMILGREGPTIHLGAAIAQLLSDRVRLDQRATAHMVIAGAGAGLAAAFNAPLAGIVFVTEEMRRHFDFSFRALQAVILACLMATAVNDALFGQGLTLRVGRFATPSIADLWTFVPLGMLIGAAAVGFNKTLLVGLDRFGRLRRWSWLAAVAVGALVGLLIPFVPDFVGGGEKLIELNFEAPTVAIGWLLALILARTVLFVLSYASGVPGGLFAPMLTIGTLLGLAYGEILPILKIVDLPAGVFAVAAMGALFAAVVRAPLTGIIVVVEMTGTYDLILPIIVTSLFATFTAQGLGGQPIYYLLLERARARAAAHLPS